MRHIYTSIAACLLSAFAHAQQDRSVDLPLLAQAEIQLAAPEDEITPVMVGQDMYKLKPKVDIPIVAAGTAWSLYAFSKIYTKDPTPIDEIRNLSSENINGFDRWAAGKKSQSASQTSDYLFYGSIPVPLLLLADKSIRKDALKVGFLYWEAMAVTGLVYTGSTYFTNRFRPETYNTNTPAEDRTNGNNRNSFLAGHVALVGTATFFTAKVYNDYHPNSKFKYVLWGAAAVATGTTAYLRHRAGKHFPTDIIAGTTLGVLSGILVPHFHKNKSFNGDRALRIMPTIGNGYGVAASYRFK